MGLKTATKVKPGSSKAGALERRARFIEVYVANGENATRAYMEAFGCENEKTAGTEGWKLLKQPEIHEGIEARRKAMRARYQLTTERVMQEIARIAYYNPKRLLDENGNLKALKDIDDDTAAAISAIEFEGGNVLRLRPHSKNEALQKAVKILRLEDAPPPPPPDESGRVVDAKETAKWIAFVLAKNAKKLPAP